MQLQTFVPSAHFIEDYGGHREPSACFLHGPRPFPFWQPVWLASRQWHCWSSYHASARIDADGRKCRHCTRRCSRFCWAFARVWHSGTIHKLQQAGATGFLIAGFRYYLADRHLQVATVGKVSAQYSICAGVPQSSVLHLSHLDRLDRIQKIAPHILGPGILLQSLRNRRTVAAVAYL